MELVISEWLAILNFVFNSRASTTELVNLIVGQPQTTLMPYSLALAPFNDRRSFVLPCQSMQPSLRRLLGDLCSSVWSKPHGSHGCIDLIMGIRPYDHYLMPIITLDPGTKRSSLTHPPTETRRAFKVSQPVPRLATSRRNFPCDALCPLSRP